MRDGRPPRRAEGPRLVRRGPSTVRLAPSRLREEHLLRRGDDLRPQNLRRPSLPLTEEERPTRRTVLIPPERAEDRSHWMGVQPVGHLVLVDLANPFDGRHQPLRRGERIRGVLGRRLVELLLVRLLEVLIQRELRTLRTARP